MKCLIDNCEQAAFNDSNLCALHNEKNEYQIDRKSGLLKEFNRQLIEIVLYEILKNYKEKRLEEIDDLYRHGSRYLNNLRIPSDSSAVVRDLLTKGHIQFTGIIFPDRNSSDEFDYCKVINTIGEIYFRECKYHCSSLDLPNSKVFFDECVFHKKFLFRHYNLLTNVNGVLFQLCEFKGSVEINTIEEKSKELINPLFSDCKFEDELIVENATINSPIFQNSEDKGQLISKIYINKCVFKDRFILNNCTIKEFKCENSELSDKFEFKNNSINSFKVVDSNYSRIVDCFNTSFGNFQIIKSIFNDFVGFENCIFGDKSSSNEINNAAKFEYATFMSFINFRNSKFDSGLEIVRINMTETPNFLNVDVNLHNSPRETFRIIKHSFDKVGNYIEANRFYCYEMKKYEEELKKKNKLSSVYLLTKMYKISSNYGQSYVRPLVWVVIFAIIYYLLILGLRDNALYKIIPSLNPIFESISSTFNSMAKNILPFKNILKERMEAISLIFYILFSILLSLAVIAAKRQTKR